MWAIGGVGWEVDVVGFGVGGGGEKEWGEVGEGMEDEGGLEVAIAQKGQSVLVLLGTMGVEVNGGGGVRVVDGLQRKSLAWTL